jgi:para-nitrobenzyl esterase
MTHAPLRARRPFAALILGLALAAPALADDVRLDTDQGPLLGIERDDGVRVFRAIPYALPPTGVRRWRPPAPPASWSAVRDARAFSPQCLQPPYPEQSVFARPDRPQSEDCLYLNVWTPAEAGDDAPVMVWIHGGGLTRGTGATDAYDGGALARKGAVVVTINYRLGPFGFLSHPGLSAESPDGVSGNQGFLDQAAALRWVQRHIAAFGGDPDRVTIFGESAGSRSVNALMVMPATEGLFHGAIGQSGGGFAPTQAIREPVHGLKPAEQWGVELGERLDAPTLADLRAVPAHEVLAAALGSGMPLTTVVDGHTVPDQPGALFAAGRQHDVPVILGFNKDEGTSLTAPSVRPQDPAAFEASVRERFGDLADRFLDLYPTETPERSWLAAFRDQRFGWEMVQWADAMETVDADAWMYYFTFHPSGPWSDALRAYHAGEIRYVFDNVHQSPDATEADRAVAALMSGYWTSFAADGDPNGPGLPEWEAWDPAAMNHLRFDADPVPGEGLIREAAAFWDSLPPAAMVRR